MRALAKTLFVLIVLAALPAAADEPPARVGRVSLIDGTLAFYGPGDADWSAANVNLPISVGAWLASDAQSRGELRIGPDSIDVSHDTQLNFADLRDKVMQIALTQGRIGVNLRSLDSDETAEVDASRGSVWLLQPGIYDIDSGSADQPTRVAVFEGSARFVGGGVDTTVNAGDVLVLSGSDTLTASVERASPDDFARWCRARDYQPQRLAAPYHVSPAMTGYEELDSYGEWQTTPNYGAVWYPTSVPADWAPYRDGRWVWIEPWGWNWVDDAPWGFAPFHYGRWAHIDDRWAWVPGEFAPEPVYAPALVAFLPSLAIEGSVSLLPDAGPPIGWFPLAPGEVYWPGYSSDPAYIRNVNVTSVSITQINNLTTVVAAQPRTGPPPQVVDQPFANRVAATVVPSRVLAESGRVAPAALAVPPKILQQAAVSVRPPAAVAHPAAGSGPGVAPPARAGLPPLRNPAATPTTAAVPAARVGAPPAAPQIPPARPNFSELAPAPRVGRPLASSPRAPLPGPQPGVATTAPVPTPEHPPGRPDFSHLSPTRVGPQNPAQAAPGAPAPTGVPTAIETRPSAGEGRGVPAPLAGRPPGPADLSHRQPSVQPGAAPPAAEPAAAGQQRAAAEAAQREAQQRAAAQAAQQQAQQRAAQAAAQQQAQQQAQQRAAQAAAQQQAQQRAAQAAAQQQAQQQQAQQRAAQAAAQQQAQQQQAQQRAAQAAAQQQAQQQAQQRAAQAAAQQQAQQRAAQATAQQRAAQPAARAGQHQEKACGHPGEEPCPK